MAVGVHAVEVFLNHRTSLGGTHYLYVGEITACGAEYPEHGFTMEEKSGSLYTLPASIVYGHVTNPSWNCAVNPKKRTVEVFGNSAAAETIMEEVDANEDVHTTFVGAPIALISTE